MRVSRRWLVGGALLLGSVASGCSAEEAPSSFVADNDGVRARLSACLGMTLDFTVAAMRSEPFVDLPGDATECVAAARDCAGVRTCLQLDAPCTGENRCEGTRAIRCERFDGGFDNETSIDCAASDANPICSVADPGTGSFAVCNGGPCTEGHCEGNVMVNCVAGVELRETCRSGQSCQLGASGVFCAVPRSCSRDHCEGNTAVICRDAVVGIEQDCGAFVEDGECRDDEGIVDCRSRQQHPDCPVDEPFSSGCSGTAGYVCFVGARYEVACARFGARCTTDQAGQSRCELPSK